MALRCAAVQAYERSVGFLHSQCDYWFECAAPIASATPTARKKQSTIASRVRPQAPLRALGTAALAVLTSDQARFIETNSIPAGKPATSPTTTPPTVAL